MALCPSCGKKNAEDSQFCSACGSPLQGEGETEARERRKTVTIVFCDLTGSTSLGERLDSESLRQVMRRYFAAMRSALESHGGTVEKFIGDAVMAVFGVPTLHEDDALRAVRAAADMKAALAELNTELRRRWDTELRTRTGVNTGEVVAGDPSQGESFVIGDAVNVAARLEQSAAAGEVLLGETTYSLVRDAVRAEAVGPLEVKGKSAPLRAYRLLEVAAQAPGVARRLDAPIVGREQELATLEEGFERAVRDRKCELITVLGPAGVGKSRLAQELMARVSARASSLQGRCLPYGEGITFWPVSEVIRQAAGIGHSESAEEANAMIRGLFPEGAVEGRNARHLASAVGLSAAASTPEEIFFATRTLLECLAREQPLVVVFDDLHWAESTFIDLVEYLESYSRDQPVFLLLLARPELREAHPEFVASRIPTTVVLEPLGEDDSELLVEKLLGEARLADDVSQRITQAAEGNPLFVEELLRMLVDDGLLEKQNGSWRAVGDLSQISMPPTIHALLGARLDRLGAKERGVIEPAAVVGQEFSRGAVVELGPKPLDPGGRRSSESAHRKGADRARRGDVRGRGGLPVRSHAHPRRRLRRPSQGSPGGASRGVWTLARGKGGEARNRVRGDPRLSLRAGLPLPRAARAARRADRHARTAGGGAARRSGGPSPCPGRHAGGGQPARARYGRTAARRAGPSRPAAGARHGALPARRARARGSPARRDRGRGGSCGRRAGGGSRIARALLLAPGDGLRGKYRRCAPGSRERCPGAGAGGRRGRAGAGPGAPRLRGLRCLSLGNGRSLAGARTRSCPARR